MRVASRSLGRFLAAAMVLAAACLLSPCLLARDLTFEDRVRAQEAIERAYYSHQIGATRTFSEVVPRPLLEKKVRTYLKQSAALERFWKTPVTAAMLRAELMRMQRGSRMPERLRELFAALGNEPFLIEECLARPALAARLVGNFFAYDDRIHGTTRRLAESARHDPGAGKPWIVVEEREDFVLREPGERPAPSKPSETPAPGRRFPKTRLEAWWAGVEGSLSIDEVRAVGEDGSSDARILPESPGVDCSTENTWSNGSLDDLPYGRVHATAVWTGTYMVIWGGEVGQYSTWVGTGGRYDPATDTWLPTSRLNAPSPRSRHTAVWTGSEMIVWGGSSVSSTGGRYNPATDTWNPTSTSGAPSDRVGHAAVWSGSRMIVWGGQGASLFNTGGLYNPSSDSWQPTSTANAPSPRATEAAVWTGSEMIVWGGASDTGGRYNPLSDSWTAVSNLNAPGAGKVVWTGSLMLVLSPDATTAGRRYSPQNDTWFPMSSSGAPALTRSNATVVWTGSEMILWGGSSATEDLNTGGRYNPSIDSWTLTSTSNAPLGRSRHTAVWTGGQMLVWGGYDSVLGLELPSGGRYDPAADSWTPTSESGAPAPSLPQAVWTGNLMIVWGGFFTDYLGTGGRYDPTLDNWTPTSLIGSPSPRGGHRTVWTGSSMIVWGGRNSTSRFNDGARYDPISDQWTPTSLVGAPEARSTHTAVWTGTKMIVWGGDNGTVKLNNGGIYNPVADSWSPTSLTGAPSARSNHVAVWTGDQMIVWGGGISFSTWYKTGGRYNLATDIWTPTTIPNGSLTQWPKTAVWTGSLMLVWGFYDGGARYNPVLDSWTDYSQPPFFIDFEGHSAVWTGSRMILWGGGVLDDFGVPLRNTGAIYDPVADSWTQTSMQEAPSERARHSAVWTGSSMIVWGGQGPGSLTPFLNTGGVLRFGLSTDDDGDTFTECNGDCNDSNPSLHPGAAEVCNGLDDDCSLLADDGGSGMCDDSNACTTDACAGLAGCAHGIRDADADGHADAACGGNDCNDLNPGEWLPPAEVTGLALTTPSPAALSWASQAAVSGPGTLYDLVTGSAGPSAGITFSAATCLQSSTSTAYSDARPGPASGASFWYLTRARNSCATATYGSAPRDTGIPACP